MDEPESESFAWTFPLYLVLGNFTVNADGTLTLLEDTYYLAPKADGVHHLAIFTDIDLAKGYVAHCNPRREFKALGCSPGIMLILLKRAEASGQWPGFLIDPSPQGRPSRAAPFSTLITAIEEHFGVDGDALN